MPVWTLTIKLGDLVTPYKNGELHLTELAIKVVERIKASTWRSFTADPDEFDTAMDGVERAATPREYVAAFEAVYDLADLDRVWIETW
jgi:hypothetical protein